MRASIRLAAAFSALFLTLALVVTARDPIAFQKVTTLTAAPAPDFAPRAAIDIAGIIRAIPDRGAKGSQDFAYEVDPERLYQRAVVEGIGNCSNLVKGLGWALLRDGYAFEIVHLMPVATFLDGDGHTVLRAKLALPEGERVALVDVAAAAIPRSGERTLDVADLRADLPDFRLDPLRPESEDWSRFWTPGFRSDIAVGRITAADTREWYRFSDTIHLNVKLPDRLEKMLYVGVGTVLGVRPPIYVEDLEALRSRHATRFAVMTTALWTFRVAPVALLLCAIAWLAERTSGAPARRRRRRRVPVAQRPR